jgi:hypothetical protein
VTLAVIAAALPLLMEAVLSSTLPPALGPLKLVQRTTGTEARALVDRIHGKGVATAENSIGLYRSPSGAATLYVTVYRGGEEARKDFARMADRIGAGNSTFTDFRRFEYMGVPMGMCSGMDQLHYFFSRGRSLYWLAADASVAGNAVRDLVIRLHR